MRFKFPLLISCLLLGVSFGCHRSEYTRPESVSQIALDSVRLQDSLRVQNYLGAQDSLRVRDSIQFDKRLQKLETLVKTQTQTTKLLERRITQLASNFSKDSLRNYQQSNLDWNKSSITEELNILALHALQYFLHPKKSGGGGKSYVGFSIPKVLEKTENATYKLMTVTPTSVRIQAVSAIADSWMAYLDMDGSGATSITYKGFDQQ